MLSQPSLTNETLTRSFSAPFSTISTFLLPTASRIKFHHFCSSSLNASPGFLILIINN